MYCSLPSSHPLPPTVEVQEVVAVTEGDGNGAKSKIIQ